MECPWNDLKLKYFTKVALLEVVAKAAEWDFNGRLPMDLVQGLEDARYPSLIAMGHRHRRGKPCEEHVRCGVVLNGALTTFDMPVVFFEGLPEDEFDVD